MFLGSIDQCRASLAIIFPVGQSHDPQRGDADQKEAAHQRKRRVVVKAADQEADGNRHKGRERTNHG